MGPPAPTTTTTAAAAAAAAAAPKDADEVEVKLRLPDAAAARAATEAVLRGGAHARAAQIGATHAQENFFFDGAGGELGAERCVLRLRFASTTTANADSVAAGEATETAVLTLKGQQVLEGGIGVARELDAPLADARAARRYVADPSLLVQEVLRDGGSGGGESGGGGGGTGGAAAVLRALEATEHGRAALAHLRCLGGFKNTRREVAWEFFSSAADKEEDAGGGRGGAQATERALLELDETQYEWGTVYELEAEAPGAAAAERLRDALEGALRGAAVPFSRSGVSKFRNFVRRTLE
jgi:hypothetical protein